ncbi:MAG: hypothetical protein U5L45_13720 [Saprospiraceae bacterium]|nr:hypothetical protein [Saprospiraceae bacterium]
MKNKGKKLTEQEEVEAFIYPHGLSASEKAEADEEIRTFRMLCLKQMTEKDKITSDLLRLKFQIEDYIQQGTYSEQYGFNVFLQQYLKILNKKQRLFSTEIGLHPTKVSQILTGKIAPNLALSYRLEVHSGGLLTAVLWWHLIAKKIAFDIQQNNVQKLEEAKNVHFSFEYA